MKIYIAAPLFNEAERAFNERIATVLEECGHETFLPQREGGCVADLPDVIEGIEKRKYLFELGYCYAKGKRCIGYKTDARSFIDGFDNVMLHGAPETVLRSESELKAFFSKKGHE